MDNLRKTTGTFRAVGSRIGSSTVRIRTVHVWAEYKIIIDILAESECVIAVPEGPIYIDSYDDDGDEDGSGGTCDVTDRPFPAFDRYP